MTLDDIKKKIIELPTFITDGDLECYYKYANLINNGLIVDLGTGWGKSMLSLAYSNSTNRIITCDPGNILIYTGWSKTPIGYEKRINEMIEEAGFKDKIRFYLATAEDMLERIIEPVDILHIDSWVEIRNVDSTEFLKKWADKVKKGGYLLMRNYGYADRQPFTDSVDRAMVGLKQIEQMGLITVFQK